MPLAVASIWLEADITHAVAPSCRCAVVGVPPFSTRLEEEPTGGQKRAVPECCMQSAPWKVDRPMMPAGLARMHVHDIVTTDERARQGHPRGRRADESESPWRSWRAPPRAQAGRQAARLTVTRLISGQCGVGSRECAVCGDLVEMKCARAMKCEKTCVATDK